MNSLLKQDRHKLYLSSNSAALCNGAAAGVVANCTYSPYAVVAIVPLRLPAPRKNKKGERCAWRPLYPRARGSAGNLRCMDRSHVAHRQRLRLQKPQASYRAFVDIGGGIRGSLLCGGGCVGAPLMPLRLLRTCAGCSTTCYSHHRQLYEQHKACMIL